MGEVRHRLEGWEDASVQGEGDLDLGLVGGPGDGRGAGGERHGGIGCEVTD